jgi:hypothetical protein
MGVLVSIGYTLIDFRQRVPIGGREKVPVNSERNNIR